MFNRSFTSINHKLWLCHKLNNASNFLEALIFQICYTSLVRVEKQRKFLQRKFKSVETNRHVQLVFFLLVLPCSDCARWITIEQSIGTRPLASQFNRANRSSLRLKSWYDHSSSKNNKACYQLVVCRFLFLFA